MLQASGVAGTLTKQSLSTSQQSTVLPRSAFHLDQIADYTVRSRDVVSVLRRSRDIFLERLVSVLKVERLGLESLEKSNVSVSSQS